MTTSHEDTQVSPVTLTPLVPAAQLRRAERELSASQTRIAELERELDLANAHAGRLLKERDEVRDQRDLMLDALSATAAFGIAESYERATGIRQRNLLDYAEIVDIESDTRCVICGLVLDQNECECPRCEADAERDESEWYRGVQGLL